MFLSHLRGTSLRPLFRSGPGLSISLAIASPRPALSSLPPLRAAAVVGRSIDDHHHYHHLHASVLVVEVVELLMLLLVLVLLQFTRPVVIMELVVLWLLLRRHVL